MTNDLNCTKETDSALSTTGPDSARTRERCGLFGYGLVNPTRLGPRG
jgi:hypothetical protein